MKNYILVNNVGGITSLIRNLIQYSMKEFPDQRVLFLDIAGNKNTLVNGPLVDGVEQVVIHFDKDQNWYKQFKALTEAIGFEKGIIISNDQYDLIMLQAFNVPQKVIQIVHDEYNWKLSVKFSAVIDKFIAHSEFFYHKLLDSFPDRKSDIVHIPYGIPLSGKQRTPNPEGTLRLLFLGRLTYTKGIFDLRVIDRKLQEEGVNVHWQIIGSGPDAQALFDEWKDARNVAFSHPMSHNDLTNLLAESDVFVFPTKFEGFPVALLETMEIGLVPVATDLPGGLNEVINEQVGYKCRIDVVEEFVEAIIELDRNRTLLEQKSQVCRKMVQENYAAKTQSLKYLSFFARVEAEEKDPNHHQEFRKIGSRLDQPWLPNFITKNLRRITSK